MMARKQPSRDVLRESCSENMRQIYRKTHMQWKTYLKDLNTDTDSSTEALMNSVLSYEKVFTV